MFTMNGGKISGNSVGITNAYSSTSASFGYAYGGGVYVGGSSIFTMNGGTISGNSAIKDSSIANAIAYGGGVYVNASGKFEKTGGTIYGYDAEDTENSNRSYAVYASATYHKETTVEPENQLFYNYPEEGNISGDW
jgi:hypothetical protein